MALSAPLDQPSFDALLAALSPDGSSNAADAYEALRLRLIRFFTWEGCTLPEDAADETINRVAQKLAAGEKILNVLAYASGVARLVAKEALRGQSREQHRQVLHFPAPKPPEPDTAEQRCFEQSLSALPEESRQLLLDYYKFDAQARIAHRNRMAADRNISLNSLRNRALRLREKLETSIRQCLESKRRDVSPRRDTKDDHA
ncbi:hypothetical protein F183_A02450 [Bryobacterales bacterium F-183]|nr:hypothetical protein F183_A02450 [Bryobacterales bacterium F-183]